MSVHGSRSLVLAALALVAGGLLFWWWAGRPSPVEDLGAAVAAAQPGERVRVDDLVEGSWERLHVFPPHTPPPAVESAVGRRVGAARALVHDELVLVVLTGARGRLVGSGLLARSPVDWLPVAEASPYDPRGAVFDVVDAPAGRVLRPARRPGER